MDEIEIQNVISELKMVESEVEPGLVVTSEMSQTLKSSIRKLCGILKNDYVRLPSKNAH